MAKSTVRLFISHSSKDQELAERLVELIRSALNLPPSAIRCTSVPGYKLPGGALTSEQLRTEIIGAEEFIGIISAASDESDYVRHEISARWGTSKSLVPLLAPGTSASMREPLNGLSALRADNPADLHQLVEEIAARLSVPLQSAAVYKKYLDAICSARPAAKPVAPTAPPVFRPAPKPVHILPEILALRLPAVKPLLTKDALAVLLQIAKTEQGLTTPVISGIFRVTWQKAQFLIDRLLACEYVTRRMSTDDLSVYVISPQGRSFLVERDLL